MPRSADWLDVKKAPSFFNLPCMGVERTWEEAWALYRYGYEGIIKELGASQNVTFELDMSLTEEPIKTHPDFANLRKKYLWNPNTQRFPELIAGTGKNKGKLVRSPLAGVEAYLSPGAIFRRTTVTNRIPANIYKGVALAGNIPSVAGFEMPDIGTRQWFKLAPKIRKRGNCVEVVEEWMLSGPYGVNSDIYNRRAMWEMANQDGSTSTVGTNLLTGDSLFSDTTIFQ